MTHCSKTNYKIKFIYSNLQFKPSLYSGFEEEEFFFIFKNYFFVNPAM